MGKRRGVLGAGYLYGKDCSPTHLVQGRLSVNQMIPWQDNTDIYS